MDKALKNKSLARGLLEIFIKIIIYTYLLMAISLIIFSLPAILLDHFLNNRQVDLARMYEYSAFVLITVVLALVMIRKDGAKNFWNTLLRRNVFYGGKSGKYYKWFVCFIIVFILISLLAAYLQYLYAK